MVITDQIIKKRQIEINDLVSEELKQLEGSQEFKIEGDGRESEGSRVQEADYDESA